MCRLDKKNCDCVTGLGNNVMVRACVHDQVLSYMGKRLAVSKTQSADFILTCRNNFDARAFALGVSCVVMKATEVRGAGARVFTFLMEAEAEVSSGSAIGALEVGG